MKSIFNTTPPPDSALSYLISRGISKDICSAMQIGWVENYKGHPWISLPVLDRDGNILAYKFRRPPNSEAPQKTLNSPGSKATLYGLPYMPNDKVILCEGEMDVLVLLSLGIEAVCSTAGAKTFTKEMLTHFPKGITVYLCFDLDSAGEHGADNAAEVFTEHRPDISLYIIKLPDHLGVSGDITDFIQYCLSKGIEDIRDALEEHTSSYKPPQKKNAPVLVSLSDIESETVEWLWNKRIPKGKLTLLEGDPGNGKSWMSYAIVSALTTGNSLPDDNQIQEPVNALLLVAEDGLGDTVKPRLVAMGADLGRVDVLTGYADEKGQEQHISFDKHLGMIEKALQQRQYSILIIDPLNSYIGGEIDTYKDAAIRSVLTPLVKLIEKYNIAALCIRHLTKSNKDKSIYRGQGSIAYTAMARVVHLLGRNPHNEEERVLVCIKNNLTSFPESLAFEIHNDQLKWKGVTDVTADLVLSSLPSINRGPTALDEAVEYLETELMHGKRSATEVIANATAAGINKETLRRARRHIGVIARKEGFGNEGGWFWTLSNIPKEVSYTHSENMTFLEEETTDIALTEAKNPKEVKTDTTEDDPLST